MGDYWQVMECEKRYFSQIAELTRIVPGQWLYIFFAHKCWNGTEWCNIHSIYWKIQTRQLSQCVDFWCFTFLIRHLKLVLTKSTISVNLFWVWPPSSVPPATKYFAAVRYYVVWNLIDNFNFNLQSGWYSGVVSWSVTVEKPKPRANPVNNIMITNDTHAILFSEK